MTRKPSPPGPSAARQVRLTDQVKRHALGARTERSRGARVRHAVACGQALSRLKEVLGHGVWNRWLEERCALNRMTANRYMRLASRADLLTPNMSIRKAYLAAGVITPKPPPKPRRKAS